MLRQFIRVSRRQFSTPAAATTPVATNELKLTFGTPHEPIYTNHSITGLSLPSDEGYFSILPNKIPQIGQLKAGLVTIHHVGGAEEKFFISGGFAFNHTDNTAV
jgi:F0F1-type ATP synthase epsilon subunit